MIVFDILFYSIAISLSVIVLCLSAYMISITYSVIKHHRTKDKKKRIKVKEV